MKFLLKDSQHAAREYAEALVRANSNLKALEGGAVIVRNDVKTHEINGNVALISGGGSGHEPAHAGYVGSGGLTAAVLGEVFTSPPTDNVLCAIRYCVNCLGASGVLLIVKNYTGLSSPFAFSCARPSIVVKKYSIPPLLIRLF
mmetsp:Transcript_42669/g.109884  ORF Transcript_42669/g.109884 Transcript_42669/m.109884 type:complete len:144 (+) Transcript_42669:201-632(+)